MEMPQLMNLDLRAPLFYAKTADPPPVSTANMAEQEEILLCYDLDPAQSRNIEPKADQLLGPLVFSGRKSADSDNQQAQTVSLPAGKYLFVQCRELLDAEKWLELAIEQQKDGLWERNKPAPRLFVRFLHEDGKWVTQVFRPIG